MPTTEVTAGTIEYEDTAPPAHGHRLACLTACLPACRTSAWSGSRTLTPSSWEDQPIALADAISDFIRERASA